MQNKGKAYDAHKEAIDALNRVLDGSSGKDFDADCKIIGRALRAELSESDASTSVKIFNPQTLQAAKDFESLIRTVPMEVHYLERDCDPFFGRITYSVNLPRILFSEMLNKGIMSKFSKVVSFAENFDIGVEYDRPSTRGLLHFDISFNVILRA